MLAEFIPVLVVFLYLTSPDIELASFKLESVNIVVIINYLE